MADSVALVLAVVLIALAFDFINGFHDSANSIATVVSTRVLSPTAAVVWAAFVTLGGAMSNLSAAFWSPRRRAGGDRW